MGLMRILTLFLSGCLLVVVAVRIVEEVQYTGVIAQAGESPATLRESLEELEISSFLSSKSLKRLPALLVLLDQGSDGVKSELALCAAGKKAIEAVAHEPESSSLVLLYAFLWEKGRDLSCFRRHSETELRRAVLQALERDPRSPAVHYAAAHWYSRVGMFRAVPLALKTFVTYELQPEPQSVQFVLKQLTTEEAFFQAVPKRFPQITFWGRALQKESPERFEQWLAGLESGVVAAIGRASELLEKEDRYRVVVRRWLDSVYALNSGESARKAADEVLARIAGNEGRSVLAEYLTRRATLLRIPVVTGVRVRDSRPESGELSRWGSVHRFSLDEFNSSIGMLVPPGWKVSLIELLPDSPRVALSRSALRVYVSGDNDSWVGAGTDLEERSVSLRNREATVLRYASEYYPYMKFHYQGGARKGKFKNRVENMIRVYGVRG
jgi:hypothetical protein